MLPFKRAYTLFVSLAETSTWNLGLAQKSREKDKGSDGEYIQEHKWRISSGF
ncbi:hypothetical protein CDL12_16747 [Handroanthus impetiginosus]|uniref:Uncharacterized protein n=1 Tax=Handroanthus impetiginosus TaxID=429701 RepID=A0A2G9H075_9LAMI|nr:hypothetical protein CDL12_16747 [Handroanthus impetiginosus]